MYDGKLILAKQSCFAFKDRSGLRLSVRGGRGNVFEKELIRERIGIFLLCKCLILKMQISLIWCITKYTEI